MVRGRWFMPLTVKVEVPPRDREVLASWVRSPSIRAGLAQRARIVLLAADGLGTNEIARRAGVSKPTVILWKKRHAADHRRCGDRAGHAGATAQAAGGDALVVPAAGRRAGGVERQGGGCVAGVGAGPVAGGELQVLHRPAPGGQGPRRHRAVPEPAG